jgi:hypothetical protein
MEEIQPSHRRIAGCEMSKELETYLKNATRGLWGKRKLEVCEELEAHVLEQAHKLELQGFNKTDAIQNVLEQIGPANIVSRGMIGVHTMPNVFRASILIAALFTGTLTLTTSSIAQVSVSAILGQDNAVSRLYLNVESFVKNLKQAGWSITQSNQGLEITIAGKRAFVPWTDYNSRIRKGQRELDIENAFGSLQKAGVRIEYMNALDKLAFRIHDKEITLDTDEMVSQNWNISKANHWAWAYLISKVGNYEVTLRTTSDRQPLPDSILEGKRADLAGKVITVSAFMRGSQPKTFQVVTRNAVVGVDGTFEFQLPAGSFVIANTADSGFKKRGFDLEFLQPNKGVLMIGVRQPQWLQSMPQTHQFVKFNTKEIALKSGQWTSIK